MSWVSWRALRTAAIAGAVAAVLTFVLLTAAWPVRPISIHVRWTPGVTDAQRDELEHRLRLHDGEPTEGRTWSYLLDEPSPAHIRALVEDPRVDDTAHLNRVRFRPELVQDRGRLIIAASVAIGLVAAVLALVGGRTRHAPSFGQWWTELVTSVSLPADGATGPDMSRPHRTVEGAAITAIGVVAAAGLMTVFGATWPSAALAVIEVWAGGYVAGALLVAHPDGLALTIIRTVAGLLLTAVAFLFSLVLQIPWFAGPLLVVAAAIAVRPHAAIAWPRPLRKQTPDATVALIVALVLLAPVMSTFVYMAPGPFPPVFYNIDTAYSLEKVHSLVRATVFPPPSLGNLGVQRSYHYATQAVAALLARGSGLLPHHALFLLTLPLLAAGSIAGAFAVARHVAPALPQAAAVPLLLITAPSLARPFWHAVATDGGWGRLLDPGLWGLLSNEAQNVASDFLILASVAGMAAASTWGWRLPAFLIGCSVLVKTPLGIALMAGVGLAELWEAIGARRFWPSAQATLVALVFAFVFGAFFFASFDSVFRVAPFPFYHLRELVGTEGAVGFVLDALWLLLPAAIVISVGMPRADRRSASLLVMAVAPLVVMNVTRLENVGAGLGGGGAGDDWVQIAHAVPVLLHAFALSFASHRWTTLARGRRAAVLVTIALTVAPAMIAAGRYTVAVAADPSSGYEYVDNRPIAAALAAIPTRGAIVVTNDLRYPAQNFAREDRQLQVPALFGHQAFAVNFSYEPVEARRPLQKLLQQPDWNPAILDAARANGWTDFLVRKDYVHPAPIPLQRVFANSEYEVYRFPVGRRAARN